MIDLPGGVRLVLASASPRRSELLQQIGVQFDVRAADIDETARNDESPEAYVARLSVEKAAAAARPGEVVIGADTTVEIGGVILGKPVDADDARRMLGLLSGVTHCVHTGVTVATDRGTRSRVVTTKVTFVALDAATVDWYIATGEPFDKAGGYAIQGSGGALVSRIDGSVSNVVGLPLAETVELLSSCHGSPPREAPAPRRKRREEKAKRTTSPPLD